MLNDSIRADSWLERVDRRRARLYLFALVSCLAVLATQVPGPGRILGYLASDLAASSVISVAAYFEWILLAVAGITVWTLIAWTTMILLATALGAAAPGRLSYRATGLLNRYLPRAARRVLVVAIGFGAVAGLTACAPGPPVPHAGLESAEANAASSGASGSGAANSTSTRPTTDSTTDFPSDWNLDWPNTGTTLNRESYSASAVSPPNATYPGPAGRTSTEQGFENAADPQATAPLGDSDPIVAVAEPVPTQMPAPTANSTGTTVIDLDWPAASPESVGAVAAPAEGNSAPLDPAATDTVDGTTGPTTPTEATTPLQPATVMPGDSLWSIAAGRLPPESSAIEIDTGWRAWYLTNQTLVGPDPDLLEIGWVLMPPPA